MRDINGRKPTIGDLLALTVPVDFNRNVQRVDWPQIGQSGFDATISGSTDDNKMPYKLFSGYSNIDIGGHVYSTGFKCLNDSWINYGLSYSNMLSLAKEKIVLTGFSGRAIANKAGSSSAETRIIALFEYLEELKTLLMQRGFSWTDSNDLITELFNQGKLSIKFESIKDFLPWDNFYYRHRDVADVKSNTKLATVDDIYKINYSNDIRHYIISQVEYHTLSTSEPKVSDIVDIPDSVVKNIMVENYNSINAFFRTFYVPRNYFVSVGSVVPARRQSCNVKFSVQLDVAGQKYNLLTYSLDLHVPVMSQN